MSFDFGFNKRWSEIFKEKSPANLYGMLRQMRYYIAVVETGSFAEAGEVCHISQSAVSQCIQSLENELQVRLIERRGRRFEITPAGRYFYQHAKRQVAEADSTIREARRISRNEHLPLRVGVLNGFSPRIMQSTVGAFAAEHPNVTLSLCTGTHEEIFRQVVSGQLDLVINDQRRALSDQFVNDYLTDQPLFALVRQDRAPDAPAGIELSALSSLMCILVAGEACREAETAYWRDQAGISNDILFAASQEAALMSVSAGIGFLPGDQDTPAVAGNIRLPILRSGLPLIRRMYAFWLEQNDSSLQREFAACLRRQL